MVPEKRWSITAAAAAWLAFAAFVILRPVDGDAFRAAADLGLLALAVGAAVACLVTSSRLTGPNRTAWCLIGLGTSAWAVGQLHWTVNQNVLHEITPFPSAADALFLTSYVITAAGIVAFPSAVKVGRLRPLLDGLIVASSLALIAWNLIVPSLPQTGGALLLAVVYPAADVVIIVAVVSVLARTEAPCADLWILVCASIAHVVTNTAYTALLAAGEYETGDIVDVGWACWLGLLIVAAAFARDRRPAREGRPPQLNAVVLIYVPVAAAMAIRFWISTGGRRPDEISARLTTVLVVVIIARHIVTMLENATLQRDLERRLAEVSNSASEREEALALLDTVISGLPGGAYRYILFPDGRPYRRVFASPGFAELAGYPATEQFDGADIRDLVVKEDADTVRRAIVDAVSNGGTFELAHRIRTKHKGVAWVMNRGRVTVLPDESLIVNGFIDDITEQREAANRAEESRRVEAVGRLAAGVAHDINNILVSLKLRSTLVRAEVPEAGAAALAVDGIDDSTERVRALTSQLLGLGPSNPGGLERVEIGVMVADIEPLIHAVVGGSVEMRVDIEDELPLVLVDSSAVERLVLNLVANARDASPRGGRVRLSVGNCVVLPDAAIARDVPVGRYVKIEVEDDGVGMDTATRERCFDPYFTTKGGSGTGLGLPTVAAVARDAGGLVRVESVLSSGSRFTVYLPAMPPAPPPLREGVRVLVVDDEESVLESCADLLRSAGFDVAAANSPAAALTGAASADPQFTILVTDVRMPGMDGFELASELARQHGIASVVYMTGAHGDERLQGRRVVMKPFAGSDLVEAIEATIANAAATSD